MINEKYIKDPLTEGKLYIAIAKIVVWYYNGFVGELLLKEVKNNEVLFFCGRTLNNKSSLVKLTFLLNAKFVYIHYSTNTNFKSFKIFNKIKELPNG